MYKTLHKKQGSVTVQLRFARSSVTFCAKRDSCPFHAVLWDSEDPPTPGRSALLSSQSPVPRTGYRKYSACTQRQSFSHAPVMCRPSSFLYTVISANSPLQAFFKSSGFNSSWLPIRPPLTMILSRFSAAAAIRVTNCFFMPMAVHPPRT